jgi:hypothetical protein
MIVPFLMHKVCWMSFVLELPWALTGELSVNHSSYNSLAHISRFTRKTSVYGPSHSSGVFSFCVSNLTHNLRCVDW